MCVEGEGARGACAGCRAGSREPVRDMAKPRLVSIEEELRKHPALRREHIAQLRGWLHKQPHLPNVPDHQLLLFLACSDCSIERAKATLEAHYTIKTHAPEFFGLRDPLDPEIQNIFNTLEMTILPKPDRLGHRVFLGRLANTDPAQYNFIAAVKALQLVMETGLREDGAAPGFVFVYDVKGAQLGHIGRMPLAAVRKYLTYVQEGLPIKMKAIHLLNMSVVVERFMNMIKPFMKKDLYNMLNFYTDNLERLYEHIPRAALPREYGGSQDTMLTLHHAQKCKVEAHRDWFLHEPTLRVDESKRPGRAKNASVIFGLEGSFKKLEID